MAQVAMQLGFPDQLASSTGSISELYQVCTKNRPPWRPPDIN